VKGQPVACVAIKRHRAVGAGKTEYITYQLSVLNPADRFDRGVARQLAIGREVEAPLTTVVSADAGKYEITKAVFSDIVRDKNIPTRARKAARLWLDWNDWAGDYQPAEVEY
jgi:hypothetical protein